IFLAATLTKGAEINVEGFEGGEVTFKCSHKLAWKDNKYFCISPCKSDKDTLATVTSGGRAQSGRITLVDSGDSAFSVTFSQLRLSDSKEYMCAVERFDVNFHIIPSCLAASNTTYQTEQNIGIGEFLSDLLVYSLIR
uniref:Immunoglobulin V-set domain-containing protein n=1 Tax=Stegastes partitus TaxID=144197 RepID=A0A3B4ZQM0_9TELE